MYSTFQNRFVSNFMQVMCQNEKSSETSYFGAFSCIRRGRTGLFEIEETDLVSVFGDDSDNIVEGQP